MNAGRYLRLFVVAGSVVALGLPTTPVAGAGVTGFTVMHDFGTDAHNPNGVLVQGPDGFLYGTASGNLDGVDHGRTYRIDTSGSTSIVHTFSGPDGDQPVGLLAAADGFLYGVTVRGGTGTNPYCVFVGGCGTFFQMSTAGRVKVLHSFDDGTNDGNWPNPAIARGSDGAFYATTFQGGGGFGIAYRVTRKGGFTLLHRFTRQDGINPNGGLIRTSDGNFYGVTNQYGPAGGGTVFRMDRAGNVTVVHGFGFGDGYQPKARLLQAADGFLYGTTEGGGRFGAGVVFRLRLDGSGFSVLHSFDQWGSDGYRPTRGLIQGTDGAFYGVAPLDGLGVYDSNRAGVVYRMLPDRTVSVVHTFTGPDGRTPSAELLQPADGMLYGSAFGGGASNNGTVFRIDPAAPLPVAGLTFSPTPLVQGSAATGTVTLSAAAPPGGTVVALSTNNEGAAQVPRSVTVKAGRTTATFAVTSDYVIFSAASLLVFASVSGAGIGVPLTVVPAPTPGTGD